MSAKNILTNSERLALISEYEKDKLNSPPPNIKDETLIKNYGSDEQKARLQPTPAAETQKAAEKQTTTDNAATGTEAGTAPGSDPVIKGIDEHNQAMFKYRELHGVDPDYNLTTKEIEELNSKKIEESGAQTNVREESAGTGVAGSGAASSPGKDYVFEFSRYTELFKAMPDQSLTSEQLKTANDQKEIDIEAEKAQAAQIKANLKAQKNDSNDKVTLQHNQTKEKIRVSRFTYENHMTQMTEWSLAPEVPEEVAGLEGEIKPPKESIGGGK